MKTLPSFLRDLRKFFWSDIFLKTNRRTKTSNHKFQTVRMHQLANNVLWVTAETRRYGVSRFYSLSLTTKVRTLHLVSLWADNTIAKVDYLVLVTELL